MPAPESSMELRLPEELRRLAKDARAELQKKFGPDDTISVREFVDPESVVVAPEYFLVVGTRKSPKDAVRILDEFIDSWWLEQQDSDGRLHVTVEFPI